jgi:hypothetical protein
MTNAVISLILGSVSSRLLPARMAKETAQLLNQSCTMKRMMEVITEAVRDPKHPFRKLDHQPKKPLKNRYERRKVKEYLHLGDWQEEMA